LFRAAATRTRVLPESPAYLRSLPHFL
jgi:hypothetical protein